LAVRIRSIPLHPLGTTDVYRSREMTDRRPSSAAAVVFASLIAASGMVAHNVFEFGPPFLLRPERVIPLATFGLFALLAWARPADALLHVPLLAWGMLHLVGGAILSVLPSGLFPFQPEQSLGHYAVHVLYALAQLPLVVLAARGLGRRGHRTADRDTP
jgi:hypothetical protein